MALVKTPFVTITRVGIRCAILSALADPALKQLIVPAYVSHIALGGQGHYSDG